MKRRRYLAAVGAAAAGLAGCLGGDGGNSGDTTGGGGDGQTDLATHAAASGLDQQPRLGPDPGNDGTVIVGFEDPSCSVCRRFETDTFPQIVSDLVETDRAAFVYRVFPVVYPWGEPAVQALEATFARDPDAFWALKDHYYAEQGSFGTDNVLELTESFLASETEVDAAAVVADAEAKAHGDAVQTDLDAGEAAGATGVPTFFLFRDGSFVTKVVGARGFDVFESALGG